MWTETGLISELRKLEIVKLDVFVSLLPFAINPLSYAIALLKIENSLDYLGIIKLCKRFLW